MFRSGYAATKLCLAIALDAMGLLALLAAAWLMPGVLELALRAGLPV
jgi:hypothetical protein